MAKKRPAAVEVEPLPQPALRLEWRSPAELAENPSNWRRHPESQVQALTDAIAEVGWAGACLYNERTQRLIDGHARKKVALEQGCELVPVLVGSWDAAQEAKILATLDPIAAMAEADGAALQTLLAEVQTGSAALQEMLANLEAKATFIAAGPPIEPVNDPVAEWQGMPEFDHEDQTAWKTLKVHFADEAAMKTFARLIGQTVTQDTRSIWYPKAEIGKIADKRYVDES